MKRHVLTALWITLIVNVFVFTSCGSWMVNSVTTTERNYDFEPDEVNSIKVGCYAVNVEVKTADVDTIKVKVLAPVSRQRIYKPEVSGSVLKISEGADDASILSNNKIIITLPSDPDVLPMLEYVILNTQNGNVNASDVLSDDFSSTVTNGNITLRNCINVNRAASRNGNIDIYAIGNYPDGFRAETKNGNVTLRVPSTSKFIVDWTIGTGNFNNDFGYPNVKTGSRTYNSGTVNYYLKTDAGNISLLKK